MTGWLKIKDTVIDYPVMQMPEDESYYLILGFYGQEKVNGGLVMDDDFQVFYADRDIFKYYKRSSGRSSFLHNEHFLKGNFVDFCERLAKTEIKQYDRGDRRPSAA